MGLFTRKITVNKAINKFRTSENTYLIDCREKTEYKNGHISGAINYPIRGGDYVEEYKKKLMRRMHIIDL